MDWSVLTFPPELPVYVTDIFLDDQSVESSIYQNFPPNCPTSADLIRLWADGNQVIINEKWTMNSLLADNIHIVSELDKEMKALELFKAVLLKAKVNPSDKMMALIGLCLLYQKQNPALGKYYFLKSQKLMVKSKGLLDERTKNSWNNLSRIWDEDPDPYEHRFTAMEKLESGEFGEAERIYHMMLKLKFELPGTFCHLARIQLLLSNEKAAYQSVNRAWRLRNGALKYVVPRIIFFRILFSMMNNKNPALWINRLKLALQEDNCYMEWKIKPTLYNYQSRLTPQNFQTLIFLAELLQDGCERD